MLGQRRHALDPRHGGLGSLDRCQLLLQRFQRTLRRSRFVGILFRLGRANLDQLLQQLGPRRPLLRRLLDDLAQHGLDDCVHDLPRFVRQQLGAHADLEQLAIIRITHLQFVTQPAHGVGLHVHQRQFRNRRNAHDQPDQ